MTLDPCIGLSLDVGQFFYSIETLFPPVYSPPVPAAGFEPTVLG